MIKIYHMVVSQCTLCLSMSAREVITVQCGHYSNFIGTHWWNLQESGFCYDPTAKEPLEVLNDCMFREGLTLTGEQTYTPRLIALDLPGTLKTLKREGTLYDTHTGAKDVPAWTGDVEEHLVEPAMKNKFLTDLDHHDTAQLEHQEMECRQYDLKSNVQVWSDFQKLHLHPKSLLMIPGYFHNDDSGRFDIYPAGLQVWEKRQFRDDFEDRLHFFAEECDHLQGFHLMIDWDNGFGGLASCLAQELSDEFGRKSVMAVAASPLTVPLDKTETFHSSLLNHALSLDCLSSHCSAFFPLSLLTNPWRTVPQTPTMSDHNLRDFHLRNYEVSLAYHSSSVMASALETTSLLYRVVQSPHTLGSLTDSLTQRGRKVCGVGLCFPFELPLESSILTELDHTPLHIRLRPLTPFCNPSIDVRWSQAIAVRGIPPTYPSCFPQDNRYSLCAGNSSLAIGLHLSHYFPPALTTTNFSVVNKPLTLSLPFPKILPEELHMNGKAAVCGSLQSDSGVGELVTALTANLNTVNIRKHPSFMSTCLEPDNYTELMHRLKMLTECYRTSSLEEDTDSD